jgi:hypothetical protein
MNRRFTNVSQPPPFIEDDREGRGRRRRRWPSSASAWWWPIAEAGALTRPHLVAATRVGCSRSLGVLAQTRGDAGRAAQHFEDGITQAEAIGAVGWAATSELDHSQPLVARHEGSARQRDPASSKSASRRPQNGDRLQVVSRLRTGYPTRARAGKRCLIARKMLAAYVATKSDR